MNHNLPYLLSLVAACVMSYLCGKRAEEGQEGWSLIYLLLAFVNFFVGLGGLLNA